MEPDNNVPEIRPEMTEMAYTAKLIGRESEVPMVSMDGEAHPNMTLAAIGLGALVALIILITLIAFITRRERSSAQAKSTRQGPANPATTGSSKPHEMDAQKPTTEYRGVTFASDLELADVVTRM